MDTTNGGYSNDKKSIEQSLEQNEIDHRAIIAQNEKDHKRIMEQNNRDHELLEQIRNSYIPDVIAIKTKISAFSYILGIFTIQTVALAYKFISTWLEKQ
jgi:hypothetical protein